eukprot:s4440_g3.t2
MESQRVAELVGKLQIRGSGFEWMHQCVSGETRCRFSSPGGFGLLSLRTSLVQATTAATCSSVANTSAAFANNFRFSWNRNWSNPYVHGEDMEAVRQWISEQNPGVYRLCWCENTTVGAASLSLTSMPQQGCSPCGGPRSTRREGSASLSAPRVVHCLGMPAAE